MSRQLSEMLLCPSYVEVFLFVGFFLVRERAQKLRESGAEGAVSGRKTSDNTHMGPITILRF